MINHVACPTQKCWTSCSNSSNQIIMNHDRLFACLHSKGSSKLSDHHDFLDFLNKVCEHKLKIFIHVFTRLASRHRRFHGVFGVTLISPQILELYAKAGQTLLLNDLGRGRLYVLPSAHRKYLQPLDPVMSLAQLLTCFFRLYKCVFCLERTLPL